MIELLKLYFRDNIKSWKLLPDGTYSKIPANEKPFRVQEFLIKKFAETESGSQKSFPELKPQKPKKEVRKSTGGSEEKKPATSNKPDATEADNL